MQPLPVVAARKTRYRPVLLGLQNMRTAIPLGLLLLAGSPGVGQTQPDATEILSKVAAVYKDVSQYELDVTVTFRDAKTGQESPGSMRVAYRAPDKYRVDMKGAAMNLGGNASDPLLEEIVSVYDGSYLWVYNPKLNEYRQYTVPHLPRDTRPVDTDLYAGIGPYRHAPEFWSDARFLREESTTTGGSNTDCFVLESGSPGQTTTIWIGKNDYHVVRLSDDGFSAVFTTIKLDQPIAEDLFRFVPPRGARKLGGR